MFLCCDGECLECVLAVSAHYGECLSVDFFEILFLFDEAYCDGEFALRAVEQQRMHVSHGRAAPRDISIRPAATNFRLFSREAVAGFSSRLQHDCDVALYAKQERNPREV